VTAPFTSPAPWTVNASGGARTIVARDRSVVAIMVGSDGASPFEPGNGHLLAAAPDLRDALRDLVETARTVLNVALDHQLDEGIHARMLKARIQTASAVLAKVDGR
jgi:hypothetical protein